MRLAGSPDAVSRRARRLRALHDAAVAIADPVPPEPQAMASFLARIAAGAAVDRARIEGERQAARAAEAP
jgi:hypothetical protein